VERSALQSGAVRRVISTRSVDGIHWSAPLRIDSPVGKAAFDPMVAATQDGTVDVTYYQIRRAGAGKNRWLTDYWIRSSTDGGKVFGLPQHVAGPFDITNAPIVTGGYFLGDYQGLAAGRTGFALLFAQSNHQGAAAPPMYSPRQSIVSCITAPLRDILVETLAKEGQDAPPGVG
jgi:hypothetical protein